MLSRAFFIYFLLIWALRVSAMTPNLKIKSINSSCVNGIKEIEIIFDGVCSYHENQSHIYHFYEGPTLVHSITKLGLTDIPIGDDCSIKINCDQLECGKNYEVKIYPDGVSNFIHPLDSRSFVLASNCCAPCCKEFVDNGNFEQCNTCPGSASGDNIANAIGWKNLFTTNQMKGDYFDCAVTPFISNLPNVPCPNNNKFAGIWLQSGMNAREGIQTALNNPIAIDPKVYTFSADIAKPQVPNFNHPNENCVLEVYGIKAGIPFSPYPANVGSGSNNPLYSGNKILLGSITITYPPSSSPVFQNYSFDFDASILPFSIDKIFITRKDNQLGRMYVYIDNVSFSQCCPSPTVYAPITSEFTVASPTSGIAGEYRLLFNPSSSFLTNNQDFNNNCPGQSPMVHQLGLIEVPNANCNCTGLSQSQISQLAGTTPAVEIFWYTGAPVTGFNYNLKPNKCYVIKHGTYFDNGHPLQKKCPWMESVACYRLEIKNGKKRLVSIDNLGKSNSKEVRID
jgi:hypothetical protein